MFVFEQHQPSPVTPVGAALHEVGLHDIGRAQLLHLLANAIGTLPAGGAEEGLLNELAAGRDEKIRLIERSGLAPVLWEQLERSYGYVSESPGVKDFALRLFKDCYRMGTDSTADRLPVAKRTRRGFPAAQSHLTGINTERL